MLAMTGYWSNWPDCRFIEERTFCLTRLSYKEALHRYLCVFTDPVPDQILLYFPEFLSSSDMWSSSLFVFWKVWIELSGTQLTIWDWWKDMQGKLFYKGASQSHRRKRAVILQYSLSEALQHSYNHKLELRQYFVALTLFSCYPGWQTKTMRGQKKTYRVKLGNAYLSHFYYFHCMLISLNVNLLL